jgi:hypothetical protein
VTRIGIALSVLAAIAGLEQAAHAECAWPDWLGTPSGVTVPPSGTLYRYTGDGVIEAVPYQAASGALSIDGGWNDATFHVDPAWTPPEEPPRAVTILHSEYSWTCSEQDAAAIQLDQPVAAVRVFWARDGQRNETVVVPKPIRSAVGVPAAVVLLGKVDCAGETVPVADLMAGAVVKMTAIRFDGSEVQIEGLPTLLDLDDLPREKQQRAVSLLEPAPPLMVNASPPVRHRPRTSGIVILALLGGAIVWGARRGFLGAIEPLVKIPPARARR